MIELVSLSQLLPRSSGEPQTVLDNLSLRVPGGHLLAVLGARGSGKSVLLRTLAGLHKPQSGALLWLGRDVTQNPWLPNEVGYVNSDDSALQPLLSVKEHLVGAQMLQVAGRSTRDALIHADKLMTLCGLDTVAGQRVESLTPAQKRRLLLAIALVADPLLVLCDDFTDGVDPKSERELEALLQFVAKGNPHRVVINVTHSLAELSTYDTVAVLHEGRICFHGPGRALTHYFSISHTEDLFHRLAKRPSQRWHDSWIKHRDSYYAAFKLLSGGNSAAMEQLASSDEEDSKADDGRIRLSNSSNEERAEAEGSDVPAPAQRPGLGAQMAVLMKRRWTVFRRSKREWRTHICMVVGLPLLALAFGLSQRGALAELSKLEAAPGKETLTHLAAFAVGFVALQVLMVMAMAVIYGAREVAGERAIWRRERFSGLRPLAYLLSKVLLVGVLVLAQSFWFGLLVDVCTGGLPGNGALRVLLLMLTAAAFAALSLGTSALSANADRAAARAWTLAFLQLPLSGALLMLPAGLATVVQPFITAYYGWSGSMETLKHSVLFPAIGACNGTWFAAPELAMGMLGVHGVVGLIMLWMGLKRSL